MALFLPQQLQSFFTEIAPTDGGSTGAAAQEPPLCWSVNLPGVFRYLTFGW
jgi:hypothetical protein